MSGHTERKHNHHHSENNIQADIEKIRDAVTDTARDVKDKTYEMFSDSIETVKEKSKDLQELVEEYVTENPYKSLGIAVLSGILLGYFFKGKH